MKSRQPPKESKPDELKEAFVDGMLAMAMAKSDGHHEEFEALCVKYLSKA